MERKEQIRDREREAWRLRVEEGWTQQKIAQHLGVEQPAICKALARTERRLAQEFAAQSLEIKGRQTAQLEQLYAEAIEQWRRSCEDAEKVSVVSGRVKVLEDGAAVTLPDLVTVARHGQTGNPALLGKAMDALAAIRAIWGLDSPARTEISSPGGGPVRITEVRVHLPEKAEGLRECGEDDRAE